MKNSLRSELKKTALSAVRQAEDRFRRLIRGDSRRILLDGGSFMHFDQFRTLAPALAADRRLEVCVTSSWGTDMSADGLQRVAESFAFSPRQVVPYGRAKWMKWDLYLEACFDNPWLMWKCPRAEVFHGISEKYIRDDDRLYMIHPLARTCDHLFCPNQRVIDGYRSRADFLKPTTALHLTGMSRQDCLEWGCQDPAVREHVLKSLGLDTQRTTVLFAPTYGEGGLLHERGMEVLKALVRHEDCNTIVKLHPCSLMDSDPRFALGIDWLKELQSIFSDKPSFRHVVNEDVSKLMCAADVLVGDFSSTTMDFALTGKHTFFYSSEHQHECLMGHDDQWRMLVAVAETFDREQNLDAVFSDVGIKPVRLARDKRLAIDRMRALLHPFMGTATENTLRVVYDILDLGPPENLAENARLAISKLFP